MFINVNGIGPVSWQLQITSVCFYAEVKNYGVIQIIRDTIGGIFDLVNELITIIDLKIETNINSLDYG